MIARLTCCLTWFTWPWSYVEDSLVGVQFLSSLRLGVTIFKKFSRRKRLSFCWQIHISDTVSNMFTLFVVWNECKVYMSHWLVSSDFDLIFMVKWLKLSFFFVFWSVFLILQVIDQLCFVYQNILRCTCQSCRFYFTWRWPYSNQWNQTIHSFVKMLCYMYPNMPAIV